MPAVVPGRKQASIDISLTIYKILTMSKRSQVPTLPPKEALILQLLVEQKALYGLQLVALSRRRLKRGTVYVTLGRMEEKGYVTSRLEAGPPEAGGLPRRIYEPTPFGRRVLSAWAHIARQLVPEFGQ
jgi:PadR family transcriptional regulator, regulatory protein PadR